MKSSYSKRVDKNHGQIKSAFIKLGFSVCDLSRVGQGCPDILLGKHDKNYLVEIKDGQGNKLTTDQKQFFCTWKGNCAVIESVADAVKFAQELTAKKS